MAHTDSDVSTRQSIDLARGSERSHLRLTLLLLPFVGRVRRFLPPLLAFVAVSLGAGPLRADTITGVVKDPSGALVAGAQVEISGGTLSGPLALATDAEGKFSAPNLLPGKYSVRVSQEGFEDTFTTVDLQGTSNLTVSLTIASQQTSISVTGKAVAFVNSDPAYRQLRDIGLGKTYQCENFTLPMDVGTFELKSGTITLLGTVNRYETGAIFIGQGHFTLKPLTHIDKDELKRRSGSEIAEEDFSEAVFRFSGGVYTLLSAAFGPQAERPREAEQTLQRWRNKLRHRHEVPEGFTQAILEDSTIDNVDADILAAIYNPRHPPFFNAYMAGKPHKDLRFFFRTRVGAIPQLDSPEEVALINCNGGGLDDGIWYSQHSLAELKAHAASSQEDRRLFATKRYNIETVIGKNSHLASRATITFEPLIADERLLKFGLLPNLRVLRVSDEDGKDLHFIQEDRKQDGSFYTVLDEAPPTGKEHSITVEYAGDKVLYEAGDGSYYIGARDSWYPNLNGFGEKALYDLTFKVPHNNVVISVGTLQGESTEAGFAVTHWVTPVPVAVAGFNYGRYVRMDFPDPITHYNISGYYLTDLPSSLKPFQGGALNAGGMQGNALVGMAPGAMTKYALDQTRAQMQICTFYFGKAPYENIEITEQPNFNFGQSWPNLVYLPISAYIDSTQRWMLFGRIDTKFTGFVQEVTPHEVAHQWFGHGVGWASYHDQWLSEGFAEFAAGLFLQQAVGPKWQKDYLDFWERLRTRILEKNNFGVAPNDSGPLWLGLRLVSPKTAQGYQNVTYPKGAYVLNMLRSLMYADQSTSGNRDQAFVDMMHDFMESHQKAPASTESFKAVAEKHMTKQMDLQQNGRLDWFFNEWVYGTNVPKYSFKYDMESEGGDKTKVKVEITQNEVDQNFAMFVPVFADFGKGMIRLGQVAVVGNSTRTAIFHMDNKPKKVALNAYKDVLER
jgi:Peptidase family M1 domain/Carboxypeptidase regulatory-like domain